VLLTNLLSGFAYSFITLLHLVRIRPCVLPVVPSEEEQRKELDRGLGRQLVARRSCLYGEHISFEVADSG
jgi:hypothetical protein